RVGADCVAAGAAGGDVAAHHAEALGQGAVNDIDAGHDAFALGDATAAGAVHADRVHLVEVGHGVVLLGQIAGGGDGGDVAVHRVHALEGDDLRRALGILLELGFEIVD